GSRMSGGPWPISTQENLSKGSMDAEGIGNLTCKPRPKPGPNKKPGIPPGWRKDSTAHGRIEVFERFFAALTPIRGSQRSPKPPEQRPWSAVQRPRPGHEPRSAGPPLLSKQTFSYIYLLQSLSTPKGAWKIGPTLPFSIKESMGEDPLLDSLR